MRTHLIRLLLPAALLFLLTACGSTQSADETSADNSPESPDISADDSSTSGSSVSSSTTEPATSNSESSTSDGTNSETTESGPVTTEDDAAPDTSAADTSAIEDDSEGPQDSTSTPETSPPDTTAEVRPPELPSHEFTITYIGPNGAQDVRNRTCSSTCVVELFDSQYGATGLSLSTSSGTPATIASDGGCLFGGDVWLIGGVGSTCTVTVEARATAEYKKSSTEFVFKATAAAYFTWEVKNVSVTPGDPVAPGTAISFELEVEANGVDWGGVWTSTVNGQLNQYSPIHSGTHTIIHTVGDCGQETAVTFGIDMGGSSFGDGSGPAKVSWSVTPCPDGDDDTDPETTDPDPAASDPDSDQDGV